MALKSTRSSRSSRSSTQNTRNSSRSSSNREPNARQRAQIGRQLRGLQDSVSNIARSRGLQWDSGSNRYNRINTRDQRQEAPIDSETINSQSLAQTKPIELPSQPETQNYNGILAGNNSATASILSSLGYTQDENGQFVQSPQTGTTTSSGFDAGTQGRFRNLVAGLGLMPQKQSVYDDPEYQKQQRVVQREQRNLNNYTASLNSIVAKSQADQLSVTGQGRGIPEAIIGGQQAQIAKEAAIQAIPVQAQIAASQGNLELATAQLDQLYKIKSESLQNDYEYKANQYNAIRDFLTKEETRQLNLLDQENDRRYSEGQDFLQLQDSYMKAAIANGTSTVGISSARNRKELYAAVGQSGMGRGGGGSQYETDLDAIIGSVVSTIPTKFGQQQFNTQLARARNDADRLNLVAAQVLKGQSAEFKNDFRNQAVGIAQIDKAIAELDKGVQTGFINSNLQYAANFFGKDYDPALAKINGYITSAIQPYRNSVTGAAWGEQEDGEYQQLFGSDRYSPVELRQRLVQTKELLKSKSSEGLNAFVNPLGTYDNQFASGSLSSQTQNDDRTTPTPVNSWWKNLGSWLWGSN